MSSTDFYDRLAPYFHLIFADWEASIERQAHALDAVLRSAGGGGVRTVLDAACGVGTQSLGLARLGYRVTASDLSPGAVARARDEAARRGLPLDVSVADMRRLHEHHARRFDAVIACDNSVPHLLSDEEILAAFRQFFLCTAPGGVCLVSVRDYDALERGGLQVHPYGAREEGGTRYLPLQLWEWEDAERYRTTLYLVEHRRGEPPVTRAMETLYYAVGIPTLVALLERAGYREVRRLDGAYYQPLLVGRRPAEGAG